MGSNSFVICSLIISKHGIISLFEVYAQSTRLKVLSSFNNGWPLMFNCDCFIGQGAETSRPYYQGQRTDPRMPLENQGGKDLRSQPIEEDMDIGYEDNPMPQSLEGLEQKFLDDIMKLSKEQNDAEDAENARHREVGLAQTLA